MAKKKKEKSTFRIYAEYLPFCLLYGVIHILPLKTGYALSTFLFRLLYLIDRRHRVRTVQHLMHAGMFTDKAEASRFARRTYLEFAKLLVEVVKMKQLYSKDKIFVTGSQETIDYVTPAPGKESGEQVIIITAHYGNWEINGTAIPERSGLPMCSVVRSFDNPAIGELINANRRGPLHTIVEKRGSLRPLMRTLKKGGIANLLIDQHASREEGVETVFFGHPCRTHISPALLHLKTGIPILPEITRRVSDDFEFEILLGDLIEYQPTGNRARDIQIISQLCTTELEKLIARDPLQWMWAARRWLDINRPSESAQPPSVLPPVRHAVHPAN